jgi:hypothetical protein
MHGSAGFYIYVELIDLNLLLPQNLLFWIWKMQDECVHYVEHELQNLERASAVFVSGDLNP